MFELASMSLKKNIVLNVIKQTLNVAFPLITFPYVSRILLEENYGKYSFSLSVVSYFLLIAGVGIRSYAIREGARIRDDEKKLQQFASEVFSVNMITTIIAYILLLGLCIAWKKLQNYAMLIGIHSLSILFTTLGVDWVNAIFEDFEYMTKRYIFVKVLSLIAIFCFVKKCDDYLIYALIVAGSDVLANVINIIYVRRYVKIKWVLNCKFKNHIAPLMVLFANTLAVTLYANCAITMLGIFIDDGAVGIYSFSSKIYQIAKNLLNAFIIVTVPRLSAYMGQGDVAAYNRLHRKIRESLMLVMLPMVCIVFMLSKEIILLLGGTNYLPGQGALQILSIAMIPAVFGSLFFDGILVVNRGERYCFISTATGVAINILLNFFLIRSSGIYGAAISTVISELVSCSLAICFSKKYCSMEGMLDKHLFTVIVGCVGICVSCKVVQMLQLSLMMSIGVGCVASGIVYILILMLFRNALIHDIIAMIVGLVKKVCRQVR